MSLGSTEPAPKPPIGTVQTEPKQDAAERRQLTAYVAAAVEFTAIGVNERTVTAPPLRRG